MKPDFKEMIIKNTVKTRLPSGTTEILISIDPALNHTAATVAAVCPSGASVLAFLTVEHLNYKSSKIEAYSTHDKICIFNDLLDAAYSVSKKRSIPVKVLFEEIAFASKGTSAALGEAMLQGSIRSFIHRNNLDFKTFTPAEHYKINTGKARHFVNSIDKNGKKKRVSINKEVIIAYVESEGYNIPEKVFRSSSKKKEKNDDIADTLSIIDAYVKTLNH